MGAKGTLVVLSGLVLAGARCTFPYEVGHVNDAAITTETAPPVDASCAELPGGSVLACGTCGRLPCIDGRYGTCMEPTPAPGTSCGTCGTSTYACRSAGVSECSKKDDRTDGSDYTFNVPVGGDVDNRQVNRRTQLAVSYAAKHDGEIQGVRLNLRRMAYAACGPTATLPHPDPACGKCVPDALGTTYNCSVVTPITPGTVTLTIFSGTPDAMLGASPLATLTLSAAAVPDMAGADPFVELRASMPLAVKAGDPLTLVLGIDSTTIAMTVLLAREKVVGSIMVDHKTWSRVVYPPGPWSTLLRSHAALDVPMRGCLSTK